jgi:hypothetical protein
MSFRKASQHASRLTSDLAGEMFAFLAHQFPVCMASDEFHYFPQVQCEPSGACRWDDFSPDGVADTVAHLKRWREALVHDGRCPSLPARQDDERAMLLRIAGTLYEQLTLAKVHETQPTYYLTIVGIGLAEALEAGSPALPTRMAGLPDFLDQARENLREIPRLFRDLGIDMLAKQQQWMDSLPLPQSSRKPVSDAFQRLDRHLREIPTREDFRPPVDLYERILFHHVGCQQAPEKVAGELASEIDETQALLAQAAEALAPGRPWPLVVDDLPRPPLPAEGVAALYRGVIAELAQHCSAAGFMGRDLLKECPVRVETIPDYMRPVRSNAAFSMPPVHPPRGGTFFILETGRSGFVPADYRLLSAHETLPGHHLLDTCRWRQANPVRRHVEFPIFYEGWASFAEELLFETGFFSGTIDRLLMAKRRFWRALRGLTDFNLHMRRQTLEDAAAHLVSHGMPPPRAQAMVRRYALKPGYQLAYTIGRRRFREFYDAYGRRHGGAAGFARRVLAQGEIGFDHLEEVLRQGG